MPAIVLDPHDQAALSAAIEQLPGGALLRAAAARLPHTDVALVGGAVRDLLCGQRPVDLDIAIDGEIDALLALLGGTVVEQHAEFGTARVQLADGTRCDVARTRAEEYSSPGALPVVASAPLDIDLHRRDVTLNAIAIDLRTGELSAASTALEDLDQMVLRILHPRSFVDDPTRLWRLARYEVRLGADWDPVSWLLAQQAVAEGALETVSAERLGAELRLALREPDPFGALAAGVRVGVAPRLRLDAEALHQAELLAPATAAADRVLAVVATDDPALHAQLARADEQRLMAAALELRATAPTDSRRPGPLNGDVAGRQIGRRFRGLPDAAVAAAPDGVAAQRWLSELRSLALLIDGDDVLAAGVTPGPAVGRALDAARDALLDGTLDPSDAAAQLRVAVAAAC